MKITEAIHEILKANYEAPFQLESEGAGYQGEFALAGQLRVHGPVSMCALHPYESLSFDDIDEGSHDVYLAYDWSEEEGGFVTAVALVAAGTTPEALLSASWEDEADDVNALDEVASAISSSTPNDWTVAAALNSLAGEPIHADATERVAAEFAAQRAAGARRPLIDVVVDPANGANALIFPTAETHSSITLVGRDEEGRGLGILWSDFGG